LTAVLLEERSASATVAAARLHGRARPRVPGSGAVLLVAGSIVRAALSLLLPSAPTYDPWAWIIWGREVAHLDLSTVGGPSWKPLPVIFTAVFSIFGEAAPDLWLVVARAGAIAALVLAFRVAWRLGGGLLGGLAAAVAIGLAPWWIRNAALGNSEGLIVAFVLGAIDRHLAGDRRATFLLGALAALLRPEAWPFLALYGVWALWRRQLSPVLVLGTGAAVLALWVLPEWWGSGDPWRAANRAKDVNPGAPTYADSPVLALLENAKAMLTVPLFAGLAAALAFLAVRRPRAAVSVAVLGLAWLALVAYMTKGGFSGNQRYLITPIVLFIVLGGAGAGWLVNRLAEKLPGARWAAVAAGVAVVAVFAAPNVGKFAPTMRSLEFQADLVDELPSVVADAGGADALRRCGTPYTGPFLVPVVAWNLRIHTSRVALAPRRPGVVFREQTTPVSRAVPSLRGFDGSPPARTLAVGRLWRIVAACQAPSS
jgi:hypothetical protein